ncbi:MAG: hypothetical protein HUJ68_04220 [Clostridia bacterium]|nr:hypothetical protein [Clostridia bacterium]
MISNLSGLDLQNLAYVIITSVVSTSICFLVMMRTLRYNLFTLFSNLVHIKGKQQISYSYRYISLMIVSYFLLVLSFFVLNLFYLIIETYVYTGVSLNYALIAKSEMNIKIIAVLSATLNIVSIVLYFIRNNDKFTEALKNSYCVLEFTLSLFLCIIFIMSVSHIKTVDNLYGNISEYFIIIIMCFCLIDVLLKKLQKPKELVRKPKTSISLNRFEDISLLYNILRCCSLSIVLILFTDYLANFSILKSATFILLEMAFFGITDKHKHSINILVKEVK